MTAINFITIISILFILYMIFSNDDNDDDHFIGPLMTRIKSWLPKHRVAF